MQIMLPSIGSASHMLSSLPENSALREAWANEPPSLRSNRDPLRQIANTSHTFHLSVPKRDTWSIHLRAASPTTKVGMWMKPPPQPTKSRRLADGRVGGTGSSARATVHHLEPLCRVAGSAAAVSTPKPKWLWQAFMICPPRVPSPSQDPVWRLPYPESSPGLCPGAHHERVFARNKLGMNPDTPVLAPQSFIRINYFCMADLILQVD